MSTIPKKFGFIRTTLALWAANVFAGRAGVVTDAPVGSSTSETWGWHDGTGWKFAARRGGSETFSALSISGLTNGAIPLASTAGGLLGNSSLSEDADSVKCAKALTLNGATRAAWGSDTWVTHLGGTSAVGGLRFGAGKSYAFISANWYYDGANGRAIESGTSTGFPAGLFITDTGDMAFATSVTPPTAGAALSDFTDKIRISKYGQASQWATELVTSGRYVKTTDTTIGPSATAKASLLNGGVLAGGFAAVTDPAERWDAVGAKSKTELEGVVSSTANQALVFELYRNGAVSATLTVPARTYGTNTAWRLVIKQTVHVAGSAGTVRVLMRLWVTADSADGVASVYLMDATLTGVDLTALHTWDVVCTIPNNASNQITCQDAEKVG